MVFKDRGVAIVLPTRQDLAHADRFASIFQLDLPLVKQPRGKTFKFLRRGFYGFAYTVDGFL